MFTNAFTGHDIYPQTINAGRHGVDYIACNQYAAIAIGLSTSAIIAGDIETGQFLVKHNSVYTYDIYAMLHRKEAQVGGQIYVGQKSLLGNHGLYRTAASGLRVPKRNAF